jgi:hypothetical protein
MVAMVPLQNTCGAGCCNSAEGFMVIVNVFGVPSHVTLLLVKCGVTVTVASIGLVPVLIALNVGIVPVPLVDDNPIFELFIDQS